MGKWTYTPAPTDSWASNENARLHREGRDVDLHYSSAVLEDFLEAMSAIEDEFDRRSREAAPFGNSVVERLERISGV
ncbi:hypothetical protein [Streptomyces bambusae]|uniref:Uncharacterized protein n=1 Tax=Streptomyces bambusae TaxID=1550616 RepID=A0ABS6Z052_9ACTN|nr:hypothetical protein [Streptomyces bambusae]MBW5481087.1 hypothetical protein [Streptomyces bambusae]